MSCSKAQLLVILDYVLGLIRDSGSVREAYAKVLAFRNRVQELSFEALEKEFGL